VVYILNSFYIWYVVSFYANLIGLSCNVSLSLRLCVTKYIDYFQILPEKCFTFMQDMPLLTTHNHADLLSVCLWLSFWYTMSYTIYALVCLPLHGVLTAIKCCLVAAWSVMRLFPVLSLSNAVFLFLHFTPYSSTRRATMRMRVIAL